MGRARRGGVSARRARLKAMGLPLAGAGLLAAGLFGAAEEILFRHAAMTAEARILELRPVHAPEDEGRLRVSRGWRPVFGFTAADGREVVVEAGFATNPPCCAVGDQVRIRYDPAAPDGARMAGFTGAWQGPLILGGAGAVLLLAAWALRRAGGEAGRQ